MPGLAEGLDYVVATLCFFVVFILLSQHKSRRDCLWAFVAFFLLMGIDTVDDILAEAGAYDTAPAIIDWAMLLKLFQPLSIYCYTHAMTSSSSARLQPLFSWTHLSIAFVGAIWALPYLMLDGDIKLALEHDRPAVSGSQEEILIYLDILFVGYLTVLRFAYIFLSFRLLAQHSNRIYDLFSSVNNKTLGWLRSMLLILGVFWIFPPLDTFLLVFDFAEIPVSLYNATKAIAVLALGYFGLRQGAIFERAGNGDFDEAETAGNAPQTDRPVLADDHVMRVATKLDTVMRKRQLYRDPTLTLRQLSDATDTSVHHLSEVLNQHLGTSFYDFVNSWRIEEAKLLLLQDINRSVLDIAMDVGFNSKSTFYVAFKKLTDRSPLAFRQEGAELRPIASAI